MNAMNSDATFRTAQQVRVKRPGMYLRLFKRPLDILLVCLGLPIALPLIAVIAVLIASRGGQPFYSQTRIGKNGKSFTMWKLRTMVRDADAALERHLAADPSARAEWDRTQKLQNDPRITRLGARLRAFSVDELPQIWNVLKGDMSLIGPRPMMPSQKVLYLNDSYFALRPGITGLWQVSRRNEASFAERAQIDAVYAGNVTFRDDLNILMRTAGVVLGRTGV